MSDLGHFEVRMNYDNNLQTRRAFRAIVPVCKASAPVWLRLPVAQEPKISLKTLLVSAFVIRHLLCVAKTERSHILLVYLHASVYKYMT